MSYFTINYKRASREELQKAIARLQTAIDSYGLYGPLPISIQDHIDDLEELLELYKKELKKREESL